MTGSRDIAWIEVKDQIEAKTRWNDLIVRDSFATPFDDFDFLSGLSSRFGWNVSTFFKGETDGYRAVVRSRAGVKDVVVPPFVPYSSYLSSHGTMDAHLDSIASLPFSHCISIAPRFFEQDYSLPTYLTTQKSTFRIQTGSLDTMLGGMSESTRRSFRKNHAGYQFGVNSSTSIAIAKMVEQGYLKSGRSCPLPASQLAHFSDDLVRQGKATILSVCPTGSDSPEAGIVLLKNAHMGWYWLAGSVPGPAMTVLVAHTLAWLHDEQISAFDFLGANTPSIAEFKRRFGGDKVSYLHLNRQSFAAKLISDLSSRLR